MRGTVILPRSLQGVSDVRQPGELVRLLGAIQQQLGSVVSEKVAEVLVQRGVVA